MSNPMCDISPPVPSRCNPARDSILVATGGYAVLSKDDAENYLVTRDVCDCTGLALMAEDGSACALAHIFSSRSFIRFEEEQIAAHAQSLWRELETALDRKTEATTKFNAVGFGVHASPYSFETSKLHGGPNAHVPAVSSCLNRHFLQFATGTGRITITQDRRFTGRPQNALVDFQNGRMEIGYEMQPSASVENCSLALRRKGEGMIFAARHPLQAGDRR